MPAPGRSLTLVGSALFVFYCTAVGVYLLLHPWFPGLRGTVGLSASGYFRGFVSGLGLVHLIVGLSDLRSLARTLDAPAAGDAAASSTGGEPGGGSREESSVSEIR